jgi:hypothetical protein
VRSDGDGKSQRTGGGHHAIGCVDVVFDQHGNAVERAARAFLAHLLVECFGDGQRVGVELND